ncbi:MAG: ATP-binding protein, partial [Cyanobium sp.]
AWLADLDRREAHRQISGRLLALAARPATLAVAATAAGVAVWIEPQRQGSAAAAAAPQDAVVPPLTVVRRHTAGSAVAGPWSYAGHRYLSSAIPLATAGYGGRLLVLQEVSGDLHRQQRNLVLLLAFAGISSLVSAALLRPILDAGLRPLEELSARMERIETESLGSQRLPLGPQPRELQRIAATFNDLLERLSASWERQRPFVNGVSHELRTPITLVAGYAARLRRRGDHLAAAEREALQLIESEAARMADLVSDLLDIARSDAGQLSLRRVPFAVAGLCLQVIERLRPMAGARLTLQVPERDDSFALEAVGDPDRFEQCLLNLAENALKYSPPASPVQLAWERRADCMVVHVLDQGPGVPPQERGRLLERFQRGRGTGEVPGSGIGLAVVDTLMQAMGGQVEIGDAPQGGADFRLVLPAADSGGLSSCLPAARPAGPADRS